MWRLHEFQQWHSHLILLYVFWEILEVLLNWDLHDTSWALKENSVLLRIRMENRSVDIWGHIMMRRLLKPSMLSSSVSEASINTLSDVRMILLMLSGGHICYAWQIWSLLLTNDIWRIIKIIISSIDVSWWKEQCSVNCVKMKYGLWRMMVIKWLRG